VALFGSIMRRSSPSTNEAMKSALESGKHDSKTSHLRAWNCGSKEVITCACLTVKMQTRKIFSGWFKYTCADYCRMRGSLPRRSWPRRLRPSWRWNRAFCRCLSVYQVYHWPYGVLPINSIWLDSCMLHLLAQCTLVNATTKSARLTTTLIACSRMLPL